MAICLGSFHSGAMPWRTYGLARALLGLMEAGQMAPTMLSMVKRRGDAERNRGVDHGW